MLHAVIALHITAGLTAVIAGAAAMLAPKRPGRHPRLGRVYLAALTVLCGTAVLIAVHRPHTAYLLIPGTLAFTAGAIGYTARRRRWRGGPRHHLTAMATSYTAMLTAFYVDNGPRLPLWKLLPPITFWFLPTLVALPLTLRGKPLRSPRPPRPSRR